MKPNFTNFDIKLYKENLSTIQLEAYNLGWIKYKGYKSI